jgi:hypothetical protein
MSIDGIGKPGSPTGPGPIGGPDASERGASASFEVGASERTAQTDQSDLAAFDRGEISLDQYLDRRVEQALDHIAGKISAEQLDFVRATLREQLHTDPVLVEMIRRATGHDVSEA